MKKTQIIELLMNIRRTMISFVSIVLFICLASAMFLGIGWSTTAFEKTIDANCNAGNMQDAEVFFAYGLPEQALEDIRAAEGVDKAVGNYAVNGYFTLDGVRYQANVRSLSHEINTPTRVEGNLPAAPGEVALDLYWAQDLGVEIGDVIALAEEDDGAHLKQKDLTVTALIYAPQYINQYRVTYGTAAKTGVPYDCIIFADEASFDKSSFVGYTSISVTGSSLRGLSCFDAAYDAENNEFCDAVKEAVQGTADQICDLLPAGYPKAEVSVLGRKANAAMGSATVPNQIMDKVKYTLAFLFVLVGVFVCYSAISRIVMDQAVLIGTKKALGLSRRQVTLSYLAYAGLAVILGSITGNLTARFAVEPVILNTLAANYNVAGSVFHFSWRDALLFFAVELVLITLFALLACNKVLRKRAVDLLKGVNGAYGKTRFFEKWKLWDKLSILTKTIINNFCNEKRRVFATLVGVIGSCALMVSAMVMLSNAYGTRTYFNREIAKYDTVLYVDTAVPNSAADMAALLTEKDMKAAAVFQSSAFLKIEDGYLGAQVLAHDGEDFYDLFDVLRNGEPYRADGVLVCRAYADYHDVRKGDAIEIIDNTGAPRSLEAEGPFDYYLMRDILVMDAKTYEASFEARYVPNTVMLQRGDRSVAELTAMLDKEAGFLSVYDARREENMIFGSLISAIAIIAATFTVSAVLMTFVVLLNLMIMFVNEKKKELIVMMINGYSKKEAKRYIYSDTILLSVLGTILGAVLGTAVGFVTLRLFSSECVILLRRLNIPVCLGCMVATGILTVLSCLLALKRVERFRLKDINEM